MDFRLIPNISPAKAMAKLKARARARVPDKTMKPQDNELEPCNTSQSPPPRRHTRLLVAACPAGGRILKFVDMDNRVVVPEVCVCDTS